MRAYVPALLVLSLWLGACSRDRDELYEGADDPAVLIPLLPALPDEGRIADCEACMEMDCMETYDSCLEDSRCIEVLICRGACSDPACLRECVAELGESPWYTDHSACMLDSCGKECGLGENWECLGEYDWPVAQTVAFDVELQFQTVQAGLTAERVEPFLVDLEVRSCEPQRECSNEMGLVDRATVGRDDRVTLGMQALNAEPRDFRGYLEIEAPDVSGWGLRERLYDLPYSRSGGYRPAFIDPIFVVDNAGFDVYDFEGARVLGVATDCMSVSAPGVRFEIVGAPDATVLYWTGLNITDLPRTTKTGLGFLQGFGAGDVRLRAILDDGDVPLAERQVITSQGWTTTVVLWPAARGQM